MAFNFPDTPTIGQQVTSPSGTIWQWDGTVWFIVKPVAIVDAPADSKDYVRNNNAWKTNGLREQFAITATSQDVSVPSWANRADIKGRLYMPNTSNNYLMMRFGFSGTFFGTAGDYSLNGYSASTNVAATAYYNNSLATAGLLLTPGCDSYLTPIHFSYAVDLTLDTAGRNFQCVGTGSGYSGNTTLLNTTHQWLINGKTSATHVTHLRFVTFAGAFLAGSYVNIDWSA